MLNLLSYWFPDFHRTGVGHASFRHRISPCRTLNQLSGCFPQSRQAADTARSRSGVAWPPSVARSAYADARVRSAHRPLHHSRSSGVVKVQVQPVVHARRRGVPGHGPVVGVADGDEPARPRDPPHLAQRPHRVTHVLEHLVGVDHAEGVVRVVQRVHVRDREAGVLQPPRGGRGPGPLHDLRRPVHAGDVALRYPFRQIGGDGARPAADVQDPHVGPQGTEQVGGGVLGGAPGVRAQHGLVVAVRVDGGLMRLRHGRSPLPTV